MRRINTTTKAADLHGGGKHGFRDGNPLAGLPATQLDAGWFNSVQEEIANVVEAAGIALDAGDLTQLLQAVTALIADGAQPSAIPVVAVGAPYTATAPDLARLFDCGGTLTLSFAPAAQLGNGWWCAIRNSGAGTITLAPDGAEEIDGAGEIALHPGESCLLVCSGTAMSTVGRMQRTLVAYEEFLLPADATPGTALATIHSGSYTPRGVGSTVVIEAIFTYNISVSVIMGNNLANWYLEVDGETVVHTMRSEYYGWMGGNQSLHYRYVSDGTAKTIAMRHSATYGPIFYANTTLFKIWEFA